MFKSACIELPLNYLNFNGTCEEAFLFYRKAFGGEFAVVSRASDNPVPVAENEKNRIMYIELPIGNDKLMGSDVFESFGHRVHAGNHNYIAINTENREEADRLFFALSEEGEVEMPIGEQFFGYFGSFKDKFGVSWMILAER